MSARRSLTRGIGELLRLLDPGLSDLVRTPQLRSQVEAIEKQAEQWLQKYASEVSTQVNKRMDQWNKVSLEYATKMYHTAEAMSSVLDELEQR